MQSEDKGLFASDLGRNRTSAWAASYLEPPMQTLRSFTAAEMGKIVGKASQSGKARRLFLFPSPAKPRIQP